VRLMPPAYVKPYVKRQKNDTTDAEAICEAVTRPNMRFVPTKKVEQQSCLMLNRAPSLHSPADCGHQFNPRVSCRVRDRRPRRAEGRRATTGGSRPPAPGSATCVSCCSLQSVASTEG